MAAGNLPMGQSTVNPVITFLVLMVLFPAWQVGFVPAYGRLVRINPEKLGKPQRPAVEQVVPSVSTIKRRWFLVRLGAATSTIRVTAGGLGANLAQNEGRQLGLTVAAGRR